jgi:hypothetical protein
MINSMNEVAEVEQFRTKSMTNNVIKLMCITLDTYRSLIKHFKDKDIYFHTYQLKEERAYRVILKYLHHTTNVEDIRHELFALGHVARNIINVRHRITKESLNLFFVDLEPAKNHKDIYNLTAIQNKIIHIEPPRMNKIHIPQCTRCQHYGHTRSYCNKPYACVKCGGPHNSTDCMKRRDTPAKCALCGGNHPANYKGCKSYHSILRGSNPHRTPSFSSSTLPTPTYSQTAPPYNPQQQQQPHQQQRSYTDVTSNRAQLAEEPTTTVKSFLDEFKGLFAQLVHQNSMILSMLSTLLNKYHYISQNITHSSLERQLPP